MNNHAPPSPAAAAPAADARDLADALAGDELAFARLYDRHAAVVLSVCRQNTRAPGLDPNADAEDALQETFIRAFRKLDTVEEPRRLRAWLYAIARHVCSERRRSASRRNTYERRAMLLTAPTMPFEQSPAAARDNADAMESLSNALDQLDERQRLAIHLFYLDPDPVAAARESLGLSRSGYYKLLARARDQLALHMRKVHTP